MGVAVSYSTLYRDPRQVREFGGQRVTMRMAKTGPGEVAQIDFGRMGWCLIPKKP